MLAGGAYGFTVGLSYQMRKKEDYINHMLGAAAAGLTYGAWFKNGQLGIKAAMLGSGVIGLLYYQVFHWSRPGTRWWCPDLGPKHFNAGRSGFFCEIPQGDVDGNKETKMKYYTGYKI